MQVAPPGGQICDQNNWRQLVAKIVTKTIGANWWPNLQLMQVAPPCGKICN